MTASPYNPLSSAHGEFVRQRAEAQTIACPYCHQPVGAICCSPMSGEQLVHIPAHLDRLRAIQEPLT